MPMTDDLTPDHGPDWNDPNVPVGDSPPMPAWPMVLCAVGWVAFVLFLVMMALSVTRSHGA